MTTDVEIKLNPDASEEDVEEYLQDSYIAAVKFLTDGEMDKEDALALVNSYIYLYKFHYMPSGLFH